MGVNPRPGRNASTKFQILPQDRRADLLRNICGDGMEFASRSVRDVQRKRKMRIESQNGFVGGVIEDVQIPKPPSCVVIEHPQPKAESVCCGRILNECTFAVSVTKDVIIDSNGSLYGETLCGSLVVGFPDKPTGRVFCWCCAIWNGFVNETETEHAEKVQRQQQAYLSDKAFG